ncbi:MAG: hypothetical protein HY060_10295 [Proteobacteria bacterium]|nr:hypothetical protein [Pseudomonadota bacterium]
MKRLAARIVVAMTLAPCSLSAQEFQLDAVGDARLVAAPNERGWRDGGLGKTRYGNGDVGAALGEISAIGRAQLLPELSAYAHARFEPDQRSAGDVIEAYARYRPVSTTPLRWSFRAGAFFPPVSLENQGVGWTSVWTLTPSAINSWVGEELRTIGGEALVEWRGVEHSLEATAALLATNDPAGILLAERGWTLGDRPIGLFDRSRLPDVTLRARQRAPIYSLPFQEIDGRVGWYTGLAWQASGYGRLALLYYNNEADGSATNGQFAWHTDFWSVGAETRIDDVVVLGQFMIGATDFAPLGRASHTDFEAAYVLVGWDLGTWRLAGRVDQFATKGYAPGGGVEYSERGYAQTVALTWRPTDWLRITAELLHIESGREQRHLEGLPGRTDNTQGQIAFRLLY